VQPGAIRPIEYEIVSRGQAASAGLTSEAVTAFVSTMSHVAVLLCVDDRGRKLTAVGEAGHLRALLVSGEAGEPESGFHWGLFRWCLLDGHWAGDRRRVDARPRTRTVGDDRQHEGTELRIVRG